MEKGSSEITDGAKQVIQAIIDQVCIEFKDEDAIAQNIRRKLEEQLTPTWHVIVGRSFACSVSHEKGTFGIFQHLPFNILVFKAGL